MFEDRSQEVQTEMDYQCGFCSYIGEDIVALAKHVTSHKSDKQYQCVHCGHRCNDKTQVIVHCRLAHLANNVFDRMSKEVNTGKTKLVNLEPRVLVSSVQAQTKKRKYKRIAVLSDSESSDEDTGHSTLPQQLTHSKEMKSNEKGTETKRASGDNRELTNKQETSQGDFKTGNEADMDVKASEPEQIESKGKNLPEIPTQEVSEPFETGSAESDVDNMSEFSDDTEQNWNDKIDGLNEKKNVEKGVSEVAKVEHPVEEVELLETVTKTKGEQIDEEKTSTKVPKGDDAFLELEVLENVNKTKGEMAESHEKEVEREQKESNQERDVKDTDMAGGNENNSKSEIDQISLETKNPEETETKTDENCGIEKTAIATEARNVEEPASEVSTKHLKQTDRHFKYM